MNKTELKSLKKTQPPLMSRFILFSVFLLLIILVFGIAAFILSMRNIVRTNKGTELTRMLEVERIKLETSVNNEIVIALKMANSPLIKHFFLDPDDPALREIALDEISAYRLAFESGSVFWISDKDKLFNFDENARYLLNPDNPENYWYNMTLYETNVYNFNINYNPDLNLTNLWINVPVLDEVGNPIGMLGTGIDLSVYLSMIYEENEDIANIFFFNSAGEITGAFDRNLVNQKINVNDELRTTGVDFRSLVNTINEAETITLITQPGVVVVGTVPLLEWYCVAVMYDSISDFHSPMTVLFFVTLIVIVFILVVFNIFIAGLLVPLRRSVIETEAANQAKSAFLSMMSHEIRTPMNAILGITEIQLQNSKLDANVREALDKIYTSGDLLLSIINEILDFSKIEAGRFEIVNAKYDIASLINDTAQLNMMRIGTKPIEFELDVDENIPVYLWGDELRIKQIMNNILSNAFKYTASGTVKFTVNAAKEGKAGDILLIFSVSDTGQGMTKEQVDMLFDEYVRFNAESNKQTEGTGLGMSITHKLIYLMNGDIRIESEPGKGSTFTVSLPQTVSGTVVLGAETVKNLRQLSVSTAMQKKREQITFTPMPYGSVLIVDDVETNIYVAKGLLSPYELSVDSASSGSEAIKKVEDGNIYDIIFMDHMMPEMDGIEATKKIRHLGYGHVIIALTANALTGQADIFLNNGFDDFIPKPIDVRRLNAALNKYIRDKNPSELFDSNSDKSTEQQPSQSHIQSLEQSPGQAAEQSSLQITEQSSAPPSVRSSEQDSKQHSKQPPEQSSEMVKPAGSSPNKRFAEAFARDVSRALAVLDELMLKDELSEEDIRSYIVTVHGMKSALAHMGKSELSATALKLELLAHDNNINAIANETPDFLRSLRSYTEELAAIQ